jgi:hypothetical protein
LVSIVLALVFVIFNIGFLVDANAGWEYLLGAAYLLFNGIIIFYALRWPRQEA